MVITLISNAIPEIGFIAAPIYASCPEIWVEQAKKAAMPVPDRTAESDAEFRSMGRAAERNSHRS